MALTSSMALVSWEVRLFAALKRVVAEAGLRLSGPAPFSGCMATTTMLRPEP